MDRYLGALAEGFQGYAKYLWKEVTSPGWQNFFYLLVAVSFVFLVWEQVQPWRDHQPRIRRDFWLDCFYMFFNVFLFSLAGYAALSNVAALAFNDLLMLAGLKNLVALEIAGWSVWAQLLTLFVARDFIHYWVHRLVLHRVPLFWRFHQVHHSVREMGFAAHLRFHWMETVLYRTLEYVPIAMIGFGIRDFFLVHAVALTIGHWNHSNVRLPLGPLRYVVNGPQFHIWHHMKQFPGYGINFGLSLSLWDYLFGTAYVPGSGQRIELGFEKVERYPRGFVGQMIAPFRRRSDPRV